MDLRKDNLDNLVGSSQQAFGNLSPKYRTVIAVQKHDGDDYKLWKMYYNCDLNEISKRLHSEAFIHKERYKIVTLDGYVEYVR